MLTLQLGKLNEENIKSNAEYITVEK